MATVAPLLALMALGQAPASTPAPELELIDMVVAQVDASVITLSELVAETRLVLLRTGGPEVARAGRLGQGLLDTVLRGMVSRELILGEVRRLGLDDVQDQDVERELATLRQRFPTSADWERFLERSGFREPAEPRLRGFDAPRALVALISAELAVDRFLAARLEKRIASAKESEVLLCYEVNRPALGGRTLEEVRGVIEERIVEDRRRAALEALLASLEEKATVRYTPGFEPEPPKEDAETLGLRCPTSASARDVRAKDAGSRDGRAKDATARDGRASGAKASAGP